VGVRIDRKRCVASSRMANFDPVTQTGKFLSSVVILIFVFALFKQHFRSPLDPSLLLLYGYFVLIQLTTAITLSLHHIAEVSNIHIQLVYFTLILATVVGLLSMILFSAPLVRIVNCCVYSLSDFEGITSDLTFDCSNLTCDENIIPIALPTIIFALCALWTHQQVFNIQQYLFQRKREIEDYNNVVQASVVSIAPHAFSDPYEDASIMS
jgi:hypothetical protein